MSNLKVKKYMKDNEKTGGSFEKYDVNEALFFKYMTMEKVTDGDKRIFSAFKELKC